MDKSQIMIWKKVGYEAQDIICLADGRFSIEKIKETADSIKERLRHLDISELRNLHQDKGIAISEYADLLIDAVAKYDGEYIRIRNCGNAILQIVVDMSYGALKKDAFYKRIAEEGVCCVQG